MRSPNLRRHSDERRAAGVAEVARCIPLQLRPLPHQATSWAGARDARYRIGCARHRRGARTAQPERQGRWRMHWQLGDRRRWVLFFHVASFWRGFDVFGARYFAQRGPRYFAGQKKNAVGKTVNTHFVRRPNRHDVSTGGARRRAGAEVIPQSARLTRPRCLRAPPALPGTACTSVSSCRQYSRPARLRASPSARLWASGWPLSRPSSATASRARGRAPRWPRRRPWTCRCRRPATCPGKDPADEKL